MAADGSCRQGATPRPHTAKKNRRNALAGLRRPVCPPGRTALFESVCLFSLGCLVLGRGGVSLCGLCRCCLSSLACCRGLSGLGSRGLGLGRAARTARCLLLGAGLGHVLVEVYKLYEAHLCSVALAEPEQTKRANGFLMANDNTSGRIGSIALRLHCYCSYLFPPAPALSCGRSQSYTER